MLTLQRVVQFGSYGSTRTTRPRPDPVIVVPSRLGPLTDRQLRSLPDRLMRLHDRLVDTTTINGQNPGPIPTEVAPCADRPAGYGARSRDRVATSRSPVPTRATRARSSSSSLHNAATVSAGTGRLRPDPVIVAERCNATRSPVDTIHPH